MRTKIITCLVLAALGATTASHAKDTVKSQSPSTTSSTVAKTTTDNSQLRQDLITLLNAGKQMEGETKAKQAEMEAKYKPKVDSEKTPEQKRAIQTQFLTDIVAFKKYQKQKMAAVQLSEPRVIELRDKYVQTLDNDIIAAQVVIDNPKPTPETQKKFVAAITNSENLTVEVHNKLVSLMKEAGISKQAVQPKK